MSIQARAGLIFIGFLGFTSAAFCSEAQWTEVHSPHFSVVTDAGDKRGREAAARFEQMRAVFGTLMVKAKVNTPIPLQIIAFRNAKELRQFTPIFQGKATENSGLFIGGSDRCFILLDMSLDNPWQVVFHEYAHQLMNGTISLQLDPWFEEGFAEYFRGIVVDAKEAEVGRIPDDVYSVLSYASWTKVADLMQVQHSSKTYNESGDRRSVFYAESGMLVHYIYDNSLFSKVITYLDLVHNRNVPVEAAIQQAFGMSAAQLDKELHYYASSGQSKGYKLPAPPGVDEKNYTSAPLTTVDAKAILADVHLHLADYQKQAGDEFEAVLKIDPNNALALRGLGYSYLIKKDLPKAGEYFHKSAQLNPNDSRVLYYSALLSQQEASAASAGKDERLQTMQTELERSIKLDPDFADAYGLLAYTYSSRGKNEEAIPVILKAIGLSPRNEQYQFNLAELYLGAKKYPEAAYVLKKLKSSSDPQMAARSTEELTRVQQYVEHSNVGAPISKADAPPASSMPGASTTVMTPAPDREITGKPATPLNASPAVPSSVFLLDVLVRDSKTGLPLNDLKKEDFKLFDNDHQVSILSFNRAAHFGTRPIVLWFVMLCNQKHWDEDGSGFMRTKGLLLRPALDHLDARDTAGVAHWCDDGQDAIDLAPTADRDAPITKIEEVQHRQPTSVGTQEGEHSLQRTIRRIIASTHGTKPEPLAVIVFLYGDHSAFSRDDADDMVDDLLKTSGFIYGINDGGFPLNYFSHQGTHFQFYIAHYLSSATAGEFFSVKPEQFAAALDDILLRVHFRYELGFKPSAFNNNRHELTVALTDEAKSEHKAVRLVYRSQFIPVAVH